MAELIDPNEMMFTNFEVKLKNRFIMYIDGIPSYLIKKVDEPKLESSEVELSHINVTRYVKGKSKWGEISMELYDPIVPSGAQIAMEWIRAGHESVTGRDGYADFYKKDITINKLGPIGDKVSAWILKGAWAKSVDFGDLDWSTESDPSVITITVRYDFAILDY